MRKSWQIVGLALVLSAVIFSAGCGPKTVATVNGQKITQTDFDRRFEQLKVLAEQQGADLKGKDSNTMLAGIEREALDRLVFEVVVLEAAKKEQVEVTSAEVDKFFSERKTKSFKTDKDYQDFLTKNKMTEEELRAAIKFQQSGEKLFQKITQNVTTTDSDIQQYITQNKGVLKPTIKVSHILLLAQESKMNTIQKAKAEATAKNIIAQLNAGADFKKLAKQYSEDPGTKDKGGYFDIAFTDDDKNLDAAFEKGAFALKNVGDITQVPVKSSFGYHVIKLEEKIGAMSAKDEKVKTQALQVKKNKIFQEYLAKIKKDATVKEDFITKYPVKK